MFNLIYLRFWVLRPLWTYSDFMAVGLMRSYTSHVKKNLSSHNKNSEFKDLEYNAEEL